ncbi:hypothetical protein ACJX0J_016438, partial [Zea mays]
TTFNNKKEIPAGEAITTGKFLKPWKGVALAFIHGRVVITLREPVGDEDKTLWMLEDVLKTAFSTIYGFIIYACDTHKLYSNAVSWICTIRGSEDELRDFKS